MGCSDEAMAALHELWNNVAEDGAGRVVVTPAPLTRGAWIKVELNTDFSSIWVSLV